MTSDAFFQFIRDVFAAVNAAGATLKSPSMNALSTPATVTLPQLKAILNEVAMGLLKGC